MGVMRFLALFILLFSVLIFQAAEARIRRYKWEVKYEYKSCFQKMVITINGQSPGPTILAEEGDTVIVELTNGLLTENVAIHWHGIRQIGTPWFDGTEGVTQCPILPGETFTYEYKVDRPGTYLYHAHYGMQREAGLYGSIRVSVARGKTEPFSYDYDRSIILSDWYHNTTYEQVLGLSSIPFDWIGEPQSLLIQGKGRYNCSLVSSPHVCNATSPQCSPYVLTVVPGKTYRLRVSSLTSLSALSFQIEGHNMTVVEADGHFVEPFVIKNLFIYSGETYSILVKADQDPSRNYWVTTSVVSRNNTVTPPGLAIFNYYPNHPKKSPPTVPPAGPLWNDVEPRINQSRAIKAHHDYVVPPPLTSDRVILMLNTQNEINGYRKWSVNKVSNPFPTIRSSSMFHNLSQIMSTPNATMLNVFLAFLGFLVMVLLHLIDWRFRTLADSVFQAFPRRTKVIFAILLAFGCTCEIRIMWVDDNLSPAWAARLTNAMLFFANLLVASLASLAFPNALPSLGRSCQRVGQRIIGKLHSLFTRIQQFHLKRDPPVLPITNMDTGSYLLLTKTRRVGRGTGSIIEPRC